MFHKIELRVHLRGETRLRMMRRRLILPAALLFHARVRGLCPRCLRRLERRRGEERPGRREKRAPVEGARSLEAALSEEGAKKRHQRALGGWDAGAGGHGGGIGEIEDATRGNRHSRMFSTSCSSLFAA